MVTEPVVRCSDHKDFMHFVFASVVGDCRSDYKATHRMANYVNLGCACCCKNFINEVCKLLCPTVLSSIIYIVLSYAVKPPIRRGGAVIVSYYAGIVWVFIVVGEIIHPQRVAAGRGYRRILVTISTPSSIWGLNSGVKQNHLHR